MKQFEKTYLS